MTGRVRAALETPSFRWGVNTVASFVVNLGVTAGLHEVLSVRAEIAYAAGLLTVFFMNFGFFRYYVFVQPEPMPIRRQFAAYTASAIGFRVSEYVGFLVLHTMLGVHYIITMFVVQGATFVMKFFFYGRLVFRGRNGEG